MANSNNFTLAREAKTLEYWRKRYLGQAAVVILAIIGIGWAVFYYVVGIMLQILLWFTLIIIARLMIKELRESLQARGEALILAQSGNLFPNLSFDYGRGEKLQDNLIPQSFESFSVRETKNVMSGRGFILEEAWFYSVVSSKFMALNQTAFEGIILSLNIPVPNMEKINTAAAKLKKLFGAAAISHTSTNNKVCFFIKTNHKIFHQFSLLNLNATNGFIKKVEVLQTEIYNILAELIA